MRERKPVSLGTSGQGRQHCQDTGHNFIGRTSEVAFDEERRFARLRQFLHHQGGGAVLEDVVEFKMAIVERIEDAVRRAGHGLEKQALIGCTTFGGGLGQGLERFGIEQLFRFLAEGLFPLLQHVEPRLDMSVDLFEYLRMLGLQLVEILAGIRHRHGRFILVVEEGKELIVLSLADGVELVVVALRAADGEAQPDCSRGGDAVKDALDAELFLVDATLLIDLRIAMEAGGDELLARGLGHHVAGELFERELIEGLVLVQCVDDIIPIRPHAARRVDAVPVAVAVACLIEPPAAPAFAVVFGAQQLGNQPLGV